MSKLDSTLAKVVEKGILLAEKSGQFALEQAPELLQEFYRWEITKSIFVIVMCGLGILFLYPKVSGSLKIIKNDEGDISDVFLFAAGVCALFTSAIFIVSQSYNLIFILTAPKLYLIEYVIGR